MVDPSLDDPRDRQERTEVKLALGLFRLSQALSVARGQAAAHQGVSPLQLQVLIDLRLEAGDADSAGGLARRYGVTAATLSDSLAVLVRRRLVTRRKSAVDRRRQQLGLTERGQRVARLALEELDALVGVAAAMGREERQQALATTIDLIRRFNELGWIRSDRLCTTCRFFERDRQRGSSEPHWCRLIERPLGAGDLRVDCPEHEKTPIPSET